MITLYDYFRSSACYRIRIALYLKGLEFESIKIDLLKGEQLGDEYRKINPQGVVPYFVDGTVELSQSLSIMEYLDAKYSDPALVYGSEEDKAYIRQLAQGIACDTHQFGHPKVWKGYLMGKLGVSEDQAREWVHHWIHNGLRGYEGLLVKHGKAGQLSFGDQVSMADLCLIPQIYAARRNNVDLTGYPNIRHIERHCIELEAFQKAAPESHTDAPEDLEQIHGPNAPLLSEAA